MMDYRHLENHRNRHEELVREREHDRLEQQAMQQTASRRIGWPRRTLPTWIYQLFVRPEAPPVRRERRAIPR